MEDIYNILAKHFFKETNPTENEKVENFKKQHPLEYEMLEKLWKEGNINIHDFDTKAAWEKILLRTKKPAKVISFRTQLLRIAAAVAILLVTGFSAYYLTNGFNFSNHIVEVNNQTTPKEIELPDGTHIWLKSNSQITYEDDFANNRNLSLTGTAFFDVAKDKAHPFTIETSNSKISVLGTSFNVVSRLQKTEVSVKTGTVEVMAIKSDAKVLLTKNESASVEKETVQKLQQINPNYLAWQNGIFTFKNANIQSVVKDLNSYYQNKIDLIPGDYGCSLSAKFDKASLEDIMQIIETTCGLTITKTNNKYIIK